VPDLVERHPSAENEEPSASGVGAPPSIDLHALLQGDERLSRRELRRQIARLEGELGELFASAFPHQGISFEVVPAGGPRILGAAELEGVRDRLISRIRDVRGMLSDVAYVETKKRELLERMIAAPERYPWVRISNEDIGEPSCKHYHSRPRFGIIGMLLGWWRVKLSSGCPLARPLQSGAAFEQQIT
jgi:hypothetical protein